MEKDRRNRRSPSSEESDYGRLRAIAAMTAIPPNLIIKKTNPYYKDH
jgi:hypothetical protein